jgi:signal transduction histidine kinase
VHHVSHPQIEERIARCRVIFSTLVVAAVIIDPLQPALNPWIAVLGGSYPMDPDFFGTILLHWAYSFAAYLAVRYRVTSVDRLTRLTTATDVIFAGALAFVSEGKSSLSYSFFTFAILRTGLQGGFRRTMQVTWASVGLWFGLVALWQPAGIALYVMRPVYLAIVGYLIGYLGEERRELEREVNAFEIDEQRLRIARDLHDGYAQVLGAVNLQLDSYGRLLRAGRVADVIVDLEELRASVNSEHDQLRAYLRALAGQPQGRSAPATDSDPRFSVRIAIDGSGAVVEKVFQILREGVTNVRRHADANVARIEAHSDGPRVTITIDDDGRGFGAEAPPPWSIVSRVTELGGSLEIVHDETAGAHLAISLPAA